MLRPLLSISLASLLASFPARAQTTNPETPSLTGTQSIGDAIHTQDAAEDQAQPTPHVRARGLTPLSIQPTTSPIHIIYVHGINQVGRNDSAMLRAGICKYLGECTVSRLERIYAAGPFALDTPPPPLSYLGHPIWRSSDEWSASAPFIDRYQISGGSHVPILLDELNWWPIVYPLKCRALIAPDAHLTGPSKSQIDVCNAAPAGTQPDPDHLGRFLQYQWIPNADAAALLHLHRHATYVNRSLKNSLVDWGFGDAIMALGPIQQILIAGLRELLIQSLQSSAVNLATARPQDPGPEFFFITHSLGSYLSLAALDPESESTWLGPSSAALPQFAISADQKSAADYFSAHTASFYFLANQIEFLELARVSVGDQASAAPCVVSGLSPAPSPEAPTAPAAPIMPAAQATPAAASAPDQSAAAPPASTTICHWQSRRQSYLNQRSNEHGPNLLGPQIIAWSDPDDLLSWNVPQIDPVRVVNLWVRNAGFRIPPFIASPTGAHDNYAENPKVLRVIFKPTPAS